MFRIRRAVDVIDNFGQAHKLAVRCSRGLKTSTRCFQVFKMYLVFGILTNTLFSIQPWHVVHKYTCDFNYPAWIGIAYSPPNPSKKVLCCKSSAASFSPILHSGRPQIRQKRCCVLAKLTVIYYFQIPYPTGTVRASRVSLKIILVNITTSLCHEGSARHQDRFSQEGFWTIGEFESGEQWIDENVC